MTYHEVQQILKEHHLSVKKSLGQNFLLCDDVLDSIVAGSTVSSSDTVLEVGPGLGFLTDRLKDAGARIHAVELSDDLFGYLRKKYNTEENIELHHADILSLNLTDIFQLPSEPVAHDSERKIGSYKVIANIPYYLTGKIIPFFLENQLKPQELVIMIQKEVANRLLVKDGKQSKLSIATQFFANVEHVCDVDRTCFYPVPAVDSAVVKIVSKKSVPDVEQKLFFRVMRAAFSNKRKQMHNGLSGVFHMRKEDVLSWLEKAGIEPDIRAEKLQLEDFVRLAQSFEDASK